LYIAAVVQIQLTIDDLPAINWVNICGGPHRNRICSVAAILGSVFFRIRFEKF
jgi:hypothetical protein